MPKIKSTVTEEAVQILRKQNCTVYYEKSVTKNLGDFNSAKVTVGVTLPVCPTGDEVAAIKVTLEKGDEIVTKELEKQVDELLDID